MFRKNSTSKIDGIINQLKGVEANELFEIELITTKNEIHIVKNKKEHKIYGYDELSMLYADKEHLCLAFGSAKYMIWFQNCDVDLYELEKEVREYAKNAKLNKDTQLHGVAKKAEKKEKCSYRKKLGTLLLMVALISCLSTVVFVFTTNKGQELVGIVENKVIEIFPALEKKDNSELRKEKIQYLRDSYEKLEKTKYDIAEISYLISDITMGEKDYESWLSKLTGIKESYEENKVIDFKLDKEYTTMSDSTIKDKSKEIYEDAEELFKELNDLLLNKHEKLSDYLSLEEQVEELNNEIFSLHTSIVREIQQLENIVD